MLSEGQLIAAIAWEVYFKDCQEYLEEVVSHEGNADLNTYVNKILFSSVLGYLNSD